MTQGFVIGGVILLVVLFLTIGPILSIMAVNHLFNTTIAVNFWNWLATFWLHLVVASSTAKK